MSELVKDWLRTKRVSSWGDGYDLNDEKELAQAAEWFSKQLYEFERFWMGRPIVDQTKAVEAVVRGVAQQPWFPGLWPPPAKGTHESNFDGCDGRAYLWGPLLDDGEGGFLPGTDLDETFEQAEKWSTS